MDESITPRDDADRLARVAYLAYCTAVGGRAFDGSPLKSYDEMPDNIKAGWQAAGTAANKEKAGA